MKSLSLNEYKRLKDEESATQTQESKTTKEEILNESLQKLKKLKDDEFASQTQESKTTEEEILDESLQVDYELSDSSPDYDEESSQRDDSNNTSMNEEEQTTTVSYSNNAGVTDDPMNECFYSSWPWYDDVDQYKKYKHRKMGNIISIYGDVLNIRDDPLDTTVYSGGKLDPLRELYYQRLFWKSKYFDNKRSSTTLQALTQSWSAFIDNFNDDPRRWHENLNRKIQALRNNRRSAKGFMYDIHCRTVVDLNIPCGIRKRKCFFCPVGQRCLSDDEFNGYTGLLPHDIRELIITFEKQFPEELSTTSVHESVRTHGPYREHPSQGASLVPKSSRKGGTQASGRGTLGSSYTGGARCVDDQQESQRSTSYFPDYQSGEVEEGEEYNPESPSFSPRRAYAHYSSAQRVHAPVQSSVQSSETELLRLEKQLLEERCARAQLETEHAKLQGQYKLTCHTLEKVDSLLQHTVKKLGVLEGDHRRLLMQLVQENVLQSARLLKKRKSGDISSDDQHKTSDAGAST